MPINQERHISRKNITIDTDILEYFCTTSCANKWLEDNLENIVERNHVPKKIIEKIIGQ
jgi:hypothetical protein